MPNESIRLIGDMSLEIDDGRDSLELRLRKRSHAHVSLRALVPTYTFLDGAKFQVHLGGKCIYLNLDLIAKDPRQIFALFHEMGHAINVHRRGLLYELAVRIGGGKWGGLYGRKLLLAEERHAWAVGLHIARQLRDKGFDLFPLFQNKDRLSRWLRWNGLRSYEKSFAQFVAEREGSRVFGIQARTPKKSVRKKKYS